MMGSVCGYDGRENECLKHFDGESFYRTSTLEYDENKRWILESKAVKIKAD
jgi:hypothetical protein